MNARGVILTIGAIMVTAGVLIELAGYTSTPTAAGETNHTRQPVVTPWPGNSGSENPLPPVAGDNSPTGPSHYR